jgi:hypothetical protein
VFRAAETRFDNGLKRAVALIHLQCRIRRTAGTAILIAAVAAGAALAVDRTGIAMGASIAVVVAAVVLIFAECLVTSPRSDSVDPQTAYVRLSRTMTYVVAIRTELEALLRHDERETDLGDAPKRANALAQAIAKDDASLLADPDDSAADERPIVAPMQA